MSYYKFEQNDIFVNNVKTYPRVQFYIYGGKVYYQNRLSVVDNTSFENVEQGEFTSSAANIPSGHLSLHEINVDSPDRSDRHSFIYPFVTKQGSLTAFKTISTSEYNKDFTYGDVLTGSYPLSASIQREYFAANHATSVTSGVTAATATIEFTGLPTADQEITIIAADGTQRTYTAKSSENEYGQLHFNVGGTAAQAATSLKNMIESVLGHGTLLEGSEYTAASVTAKITVTDDESGKITLTQATLGAAGNTVITSNLSNVTVTGWSGGSDGTTVDYFNKNDDAGDSNRIVALKNTLNYYKHLSSHYAYSSSLDDSEGGWNKSKQELGLISVPSIFYGSSIKKGSVELNFYVTGSLIGQLKDENRNGELIQTLPVGHSESGSVAGVVLYNEGFVLLTGSWDISNGEHTEPYLGSAELSPSWVHYGAGANDEYMQTGLHTASSFQMSFYGASYTPVLTMFARAPKLSLNHSNNVTFINQDDIGRFTKPSSGSFYYVEPEDVKIKNIVSGSHTDHTASFKKQTYISKIGLYDEERNLIAIAKMATPVKKTEDRDLTFKLKLDI